MAQKFKDHGRLIIYFREKHRHIKEEFSKLVRKDPTFLRLKKEAQGGSPSMISIGIVTLMNRYIHKRKQEMEEKKESEK